MKKILASFVLLFVALAASAADAPTLDELRQSGIVGERYDGIVVLRADDVSSATRQVVESLNAQRREIYRKRATEQDVPVDQVGRVYAKEIFGKAPESTWFLGADGNWTQK